MIQSLRAKDQFTYRIEKDPGTECFQVIKLIVQPIVENALYHGLEGMYGDGEIVIHAYTKDGDLYISVKDNGMGMSKEQAEALLDYTKELKTAKGNGIGVRNVHERIQLHFGKNTGYRSFQRKMREQKSCCIFRQLCMEKRKNEKGKENRYCVRGDSDGCFYVSLVFKFVWRRDEKRYHKNFCDRDQEKKQSGRRF